MSKQECHLSRVACISMRKRTPIGFSLFESNFQVIVPFESKQFGMPVVIDRRSERRLKGPLSCLRAIALKDSELWDTLGDRFGDLPGMASNRSE